MKEFIKRIDLYFIIFKFSSLHIFIHLYYPIKSEKNQGFERIFYNKSGIFLQIK